MQLATLLATQLTQIMESGKVTLYTDNAQDLEVKAEKRKIDLNATNKKFVKDMISSVRGTSKQFAPVKTKKNKGKLQSVRNLLDTFKGVAEELQDAGITITLSYKGDKLVTLGANANPKLSRFLTGRAIEVNNLPKLVEVAI